MNYFELLNKNEVEAIHENALRLLGEVGVIFDYRPAVEILKRAGCKVDGQKAFFPKTLVEEMIGLPPSEFILYGRDKESNVVFNQDALVMIPCYGAPFVNDIDKGRREGTREDFINFTKLTEESPYLDMASTVPCEMTDVPIQKRTAEYIRTALSYCKKPMVVSKDATTMMHAFEQCCILYGDRKTLIEKPRFISITDSFSPLRYDETMSKMLIYCAENGIPQRIGGLGVGGLTTPVTLAGNLSQMTAEALAGVVLSQLIRPGVPVVLNNSSSAADMKTLALTVGAPECALVCIGTSQMARFYGWPCRSGGTISDAKIVDAQAGAESMANLLTAALTGTNYILHAAGIMEAYMVSSLEKFVLDEENCGIVKHIRKGIPVNEDTLAFDTIKKGQDAGFLTQSHTYRHYKSFYEPRIYDRNTYIQWKESGAKDIAVVANKVWKKRVKNYVKPELSMDLDRSLRKYLAEC